MLATRTSERVLVVVLVVLLAAIAVVIVTGSASSSAPAQRRAGAGFDGPTLPPHLRAANFSLLDQNGHRVTLSQYHGKVVLVTFVHSLCKGLCPFMVEQIKGALNELPSYRAAVPVLAVSADPSQDTVAHRRAFLAKHEMTGRMHYLNGPAAAMRRVYHAWAVQPVVGRNDNHSTFVFLVDKRGFERVGWPGAQLTPDQLAHDIRMLEQEPS